MDPLVSNIIVMSYFVKDPLQGRSMSQYSGVVVDRDTVCYLAEEYN